MGLNTGDIWGDEKERNGAWRGRLVTFRGRGILIFLEVTSKATRVVSRGCGFFVELSRWYYPKVSFVGLPVGGILAYRRGVNVNPVLDRDLLAPPGRNKVFR